MLFRSSVYVIQKSTGKNAEGKDEEQLTVTRRFVKTGATRGDLVAISNGLKAGEEVATSGLLKLQNGTRVIINNSVTPSASAAPTPDES